MNQLIAPFQMIWTHRRMLNATTNVELRQIYAGSALGIAWAWLGPLLLLALYSLIYAFIFRIKPAGMEQSEYILYVFAGLGPFLAFSQALISGALALGKSRQLLLNTVFPADLLPVRTVLVASASLPTSLGVVIVASIIYGHPSALTLLVVPVVAGQLMLSFGLAWMLSLLVLLLRDIQQLLQYISMVLMIATPIAYTPDMIPHAIRFAMWFNPLTYYVVAYQDLIVFGRLPPLPIIAGIFVISIGGFWLGGWVFNRTKREMLEYA